jgi:hypothetical protein
LYIRTLGRKPTNEELVKLSSIVASEQDQKRALEDVFWGLLNSREFMFNH